MLTSFFFFSKRISAVMIAFEITSTHLFNQTTCDTASQTEWKSRRIAAVLRQPVFEAQWLLDSFRIWFVHSFKLGRREETKQWACDCLLLLGLLFNLKVPQMRLGKVFSFAKIGMTEEQCFLSSSGRAIKIHLVTCTRTMQPRAGYSTK